MSQTSKQCPLCGRKNNPLFAQCYECKHDLSQPASQEQMAAYHQKKGLPMGVILFIVLSLFGIVGVLQTFTNATWHDLLWYEWIQTVGLNICLAILVFGLIRSREWARKGVIFYQAIVFLMALFISFSPVSKNSASYKLMLKKYLQTHQNTSQGQGSPTGEEAAKNDLDSFMTKGRPFMIGVFGIFSFIWIYYFSVPVRKYFDYKNPQSKITTG